MSLSRACRQKEHPIVSTIDDIDVAFGGAGARVVDGDSLGARVARVGRFPKFDVVQASAGRVEPVDAVQINVRQPLTAQLA